jgi:hypothetical protein
MTVFWVVAPCSLVEVYRRFTGASDRPDDGGSKHLWNVDKLLPDYTTQQPRTQSSSYSPPQKPQIMFLIGGLFKDAVISSDYTASNDKRTRLSG